MPTQKLLLASLAALFPSIGPPATALGPSAGPPNPQGDAPEPLRGVEGIGGTNLASYRIRARLEERPAGTKDANPAEAGEAEGDQAAEPGDALLAPPRPHYTLEGSLTLTLENRGPDPLEELFFHVYWNAFSNDQSIFLEDTGGRLRGTLLTDEWGLTEIQRVSLVDGEDLTDSIEWRAPGLETSADRTVLRVPLTEPLAPDGTLEVEVEWRSVVPRVRRRTGSKDNFLLIAHWFPKLGVYEHGRGWNCHPFSSRTEFYADFGTYDVMLDLPAEFRDQVFGSGERTLQNTNGDRVEVLFRAPAEEDRRGTDALGHSPLVHDFAFAADPDFVVVSDTFKFSDWADAYPEQVDLAREAFGEEFEPAQRDVTVDVLIQPEREVQAARHFRATSAALFFYGLWFGEYPYKRITVVDPPWGGRAAGGMEYQTLFTAGTRLFTRESMATPEGVTIHEAGHQWFQGLLASNEFEAAWLDEGFNSWADAEVQYLVYGDQHQTTNYASVPFDGIQWARFGSGASGRAVTFAELRLPSLGWLGIDSRLALQPMRSSGFLDMWREQPLLSLMPRRVDPRDQSRSRYLRAPGVDPVDTWGWHCRDVGVHRTNTYARTATVMRSMPALFEASDSEVDGQRALFSGMRSYAEGWRFRHPYPDDFFAAFQAGDGVDLDLDPLFEDLFRGTGTVDWTIGVSQRRAGDPKGFVMGTDGRFATYPDGQDDEEDGEDEEEAEDAKLWLQDVVVQREGALCLPVEIEFEWEDGETERLVWTREEQQEKRWLRIELSRSERLVRASVDPDAGYFLDTDRSNNNWFRPTDHVAPVRWAERAFTQLCQRLHWQKGLGG